MELINDYPLLQSNKCLLRLTAEAKLRWLMHLKVYSRQGNRDHCSYTFFHARRKSREVYFTLSGSIEDGVSIKGLARYILIPHDINILEYF